MPMCKTVYHCYEGGSKTVVDRYHSGNNLGTGPVLFQYYNVYWVYFAVFPMNVSWLEFNFTDFEFVTMLQYTARTFFMKTVCTQMQTNLLLESLCIKVSH